MKLIRCIQILVLLLAGVILTGCGNKLTSANLDLVKTSMSKQEVEAILGKPSDIKTQDIPLIATSQYVYKSGDDEVLLIFLNDKLLTKTGSFSK